jgi:hypothetical protein
MGSKLTERKKFPCHLIKLAWIATIYHFWLEMRARVGNGRIHSVDKIFRMIIAAVRDKLSSCTKFKNPTKYIAVVQM